MLKRATVICLLVFCLLLFAVLGSVACNVLPPEALGLSAGVTTPTGPSRIPDTGSLQEASGAEGAAQADAESPGEEVDDPVSAASGVSDLVDDPASGDYPGQLDTIDETAAGDAPDEPDKDTYWIDVDVAVQQVAIMRGDEVIKTMLCSTGAEGHETPLGTFEIQNRGEWFFNERYQQGAKYWVSFKDWGVYLFHSLAMDRNQQVIPEEAAKLGQPASHGCIRLSIEDAKWIYENIPAKTKVVIHE